MTNSLIADTTAIASEVNQNFTDILTALNAYDASNLNSGTIPLARISGLTSTQMAATYFLDEDDMSSDSATAVSSQQALKAYIASQIAAAVTLSAYTNQDSESNAMLKSHAYLAATGGQVTAYVQSVNPNLTLKGYVGATNDPAGAGDLICDEKAVDTSEPMSITFLVAEGEYFEVVVSTSTPTIRWKSFGTLSKPVDQD